MLPENEDFSTICQPRYQPDLLLSIWKTITNRANTYSEIYITFRQNKPNQIYNLEEPIPN